MKQDNMDMAEAEAEVRLQDDDTMLMGLFISISF